MLKPISNKWNSGLRLLSTHPTRPGSSGGWRWWRTAPQSADAPSRSRRSEGPGNTSHDEPGRGWSWEEEEGGGIQSLIKSYSQSRESSGLRVINQNPASKGWRQWWNSWSLLIIVQNIVRMKVGMLNIWPKSHNHDSLKKTRHLVDQRWAGSIALFVCFLVG